MSVAASLAALRHSVKRPSQKPASVARSELAASARNALTLLQRGDKQLGRLLRPLLLLSPDADRLTLMPETEQQLQAAAVELIRRLAPVFPLRSTQSVLEWLLVGLSLATHGSDNEYDQLIISALPFCEQQLFVRLVKRMAPLRPKWEFLWPVVKQSKPPPLGFMVNNFPQHLFPLLIQSATRSASMHLPVSSISSFLSNTLTRRVIVQSEAPILTLACIDALQKFTSKEFSKRAKYEPVNLIAAMLSAVCVAMTAKLVDSAVLQAASHACACVLLKCNEPDLKRSAASCLVFTSSALPAFVPAKVARSLLRSSVLLPELKRLNPSDASSVFGALVLTSIGHKPKSIRWPLLKEAFSVSSLLTKDVVRLCLVDLLDKLSPEVEPQKLVREDAVDGLASVIAPLARGRFAEAVDLALREHFNRRKKKGRSERYGIVDEALTKGLLGTQFASVNSTEDLTSISLSAALDHPEPSVRRATLQHFAERKDFMAHAEADALKAISTKLTTMIRLEEDLEIVVSACDCFLKVARQQDIQAVLVLVFTRYIGEHERIGKTVLKSKKTKKKCTFLKPLFSRILIFCGMLVDQNGASIHALLSGLVMAGYVPNDLEKGDDETALVLLSKHWEKMKLENPAQESEGGDIQQLVTVVVQGMLSFDKLALAKFCDALTSWDGKWVLNVSNLWLQHLEKGTPSKSTEQKLVNILLLLSRACEAQAHLLHQVVLLLAKHSKLFCKLPSSVEAKLAIISEIWSLVAKDGSDQACQTFLHAIVSEFNLASCIELLKEMSLSGTTRETKIVSLRWYISLCVLHPSEDVRKGAMTILIRTIYSNDEQIQKAALDVCGHAAKGEGLKKRELRTELWTFLSMVSKLRNDYKRNPLGGELQRVISTDIQRKVIEPIKTPSPLLCAEQVKTKTPLNFDALMLNALREKDSQHVLNAYLRALHGYRIRTAEQCSSIISLLSSQLSSLLSSRENLKINLENVSRLTQTLAEVPVEILSEASTLTNLSSLTTSQLKILASKPVSFYESYEELLTTLLGLAALLVSLREYGLNKQFRIPLLGFLFSFSTSSSRIGVSVRRNIDMLCRGSIYVEELVLILKTGYVTLSPSAKRQKVSAENVYREYSEVAREACRGILEALLRWTSKNEMNRFPYLPESLDGLKSCFSDLLVSSTALKEDGRSSMDDLEYDLSLLLQVQTVLYEIQPSKPSRSIDIKEIAEIAQYVRDGGEETPVTSAVRQNAVQLLEILAPIYGSDMHEVLAPVVENLVSKGDPTRSLISLKAFVPALVESGCEFERICSWVVEAGYSSSSLSDFSHGTVLLSSCCRLVSDSKQAAITSIRHLEKCLQHVDDDVVARECATNLLGVKMNAVDDISTLRILPGRIRCRAAFTVLQSPVFITKLCGSAIESSSPEGVALSNAFSFLFLELLVCDDLRGRRDSVAALIAILPLPLFGKCVFQGLSSKDSKVRTRTMITLKERLELDDAPITYSWKKDELSVLGTKEVSSIELSFLKEVGATLCNICKGTYSFVTYDERITAASTMEKLVTAMGSSHQQAVLSFASRMLELVSMEKITACLSEMGRKKAECQLASNCLDLFSSFVRCLEKNAVPFVPVVLASATEVLEKVFNPKELSRSLETGYTCFSTLVSVSEAAVKFITTVLDSCPGFLGTRTLQSLIILCLSSDADVLSELLQLAMSKAPPGTIAAALSRATDKLRESNASRGGISRVMRALAAGLDKMHKSEIRLSMYQFERSILSCLEFERLGPGDSLMAGVSKNGNAKNSRKSIDSLLSEFREVDQSCSEALISLIMKLPEFKFKKLFNGLVQWCESGALSIEAQVACETLEVDVISNVTRATPFYQLILHLCQKMHTIMVPYVFQVFEGILNHISRKMSEIRDTGLEEDGVESPNRKRKRAEVEKESQFLLCSMLVRSEEHIIQDCLEIVTLLLKQKLGPELFTTTVATKILHSLLTAFDNSNGESERVAQAMCALATRIAAAGKASESPDSSRELLVSFARSLLLRTREASAGIRTGALRISCVVAQAVGDEYLVTLPESMPVLAEVIDDEQSLVRKEAKRYVRILEGLAGESIMDQLK